MTVLGSVGDIPLDFGGPSLEWRLIILGIVSDTPGDGGLPSWGWWMTILGKLGDHHGKVNDTSRVGE